MPPSKKESNGPTSSSRPPASRRSARIADKPKSTATNGDKAKKVTESKKRPAENTANGDDEKKASKKAKPSSLSPTKEETKSTSKKATTSKTVSASASAKKEKELEASANAEPETSSRGQLKKGDKLPKIKLQDNTGTEVDVSTLAGEKGVVFFLYPKADTPGCTTQACGFRDSYDEISELGYEIYGLSRDTPAAQQKWITKKELNYKLLCDPESKLIKRLGAFVLPKNVKRSHFIFEKETGKLVDIALGVKPATDPENVLKFLKQHHK
ncbi:hypothetical protein CI109_102398 [Kwoniella shandongensis]|uniref:thioredoxin-dependent peroxiredoxin n=1 Tax=Kwoniella shandongensis TaxID=1734106 RepID=A0A5M6C035_9TREE|nr:uncharacterized protein CI109_003283 [Kwoniella shandongensis]KAA5528383.1 hypothetical protein CI109_003283 [Kwoniella shandongensis]